MTFHRALILLAGMTLPFLTACTTLYSTAPVAIVEPPQNASSTQAPKDNTRVNYGLLPAQNFRIADDVADRPLVVRQNPEMVTGRTWDFGIRKPFSDHLELGISGFPILSTNLSGQLIGMAKYQLLGNTYEKIQQHPFDLAIYSHVIFTEVNLSGNQRRLFGEGGYPWNAESHFQGVSAGISIGKTISRNFYIYSGVAHQQFQIDASVNQSASHDGDYPSASYQIPRSSGTSDNILFGFSFGVRHQINVTYNFSKSKWRDLTADGSGLNVNLLFYEFGKAPQTVEPNK
ncbi:MAG: hypothetical protein JNL11_01280 [Bdellovibrionaceae bacterium]|nr:hypothetical protein [Pseudobdellovibrionaceae bacterium]